MEKVERKLLLRGRKMTRRKRSGRRRRGGRNKGRKTARRGGI